MDTTYSEDIQVFVIIQLAVISVLNNWTRFINRIYSITYK